MDFQNKHYEGLPYPYVIQSKKKQELISYLCKMLHFPLISEKTGSTISHLITPSKNGQRTAAVSDSRGLTWMLDVEANWRLYLMYLFKILIWITGLKAVMAVLSCLAALPFLFFTQLQQSICIGKSFRSNGHIPWTFLFSKWDACVYLHTHWGIGRITDVGHRGQLILWTVCTLKHVFYSHPYG